MRKIILSTIILSSFLMGFFFVKPKETCAQQLTPQQVDCIGKQVAAYLDALVVSLSLKGGLQHVELLTPAFNMTSIYYNPLVNAVAKYSAAFESLDYAAGNAYNISGVLITQWAEQAMSNPNMAGKRLVLTEIGNLDGKPENLASESIKIKDSAANGGLFVTGLYFNSFGTNSDPLWAGFVMNDNQHYDACGGPCVFMGVNYANFWDAFDRNYNFQRAQNLGMNYALFIISSAVYKDDNFLNAIRDLHSKNITPIIRIGVGENATGFESAATYANVLEWIDDNVQKPVYAIAGPNEPSLEYWVSKGKCSTPNACQDGSDFHSLRPFPSCPLIYDTSPAYFQCGNDLIIEENLTIPYLGFNVNPGVSNVEIDRCESIGTNEVKCYYTILNKEVPINVDFTNSEFPIAGLTQSPYIANSVEPVASAPLYPQQKVNEYLSWYLHGINNRAEDEVTKTPGENWKIIDYSGPLNKLLPWRILTQNRIDTIDKSNDLNPGIKDFTDKYPTIQHNQIVGCTTILPGFLGLNMPCYGQGLGDFINAYINAIQGGDGYSSEENASAIGQLIDTLDDDQFGEIRSDVVDELYNSFDIDEICTDFFKSIPYIGPFVSFSVCDILIKGLDFENRSKNWLANENNSLCLGIINPTPFGQNCIEPSFNGIIWPFPKLEIDAISNSTVKDYLKDMLGAGAKSSNNSIFEKLFNSIKQIILDYLSSLINIGGLIEQHRLSKWGDRKSQLPPLPEEYEVDLLDPFQLSYWNKYLEWRGERCVSFLGISYCSDEAGADKDKSRANLWRYVPLASTEDLEGFAIIDTTYTVQPPSNIENIQVSFEPEDGKIQHSLYFAHMVETTDLTASLQNTYASQDTDTKGTLEQRLNYPSGRCIELTRRSNAADSLFGNKQGNGTGFSGNLKYSGEFSCTFTLASGTGSTNPPISPNIPTEPDPTPLPPGGGNPSPNPSPTPAPAIPTCTINVAAATSIFVNTPRIEELYNRTVDGPQSIFKRFFPKLGEIDSPLQEIKDLPSFTTVLYQATADKVWAGEQGTRDGSAAEIYFPHMGSIYDYFLQGLQVAIRPFGYGNLISDIGQNPRPDPDTVINCNQNVSDASFPAFYKKGGTFYQNADRLLTLWVPRGKNYLNECYNDVISRALQAGINPAFAMSIWIEESNASNYTAFPDVLDFGVRIQPMDFTAQIERFLVLPSRYKQQYNQCFVDGAAAGYTPMEVFAHIFRSGPTEDEQGRCLPTQGDLNWLLYKPNSSIKFTWDFILNGTSADNCSLPNYPDDNTCPN